MSPRLFLVAVGSLLALAGREDSVELRLQSGAVLARSFESRQEVSEDEVEMLLNGQPIPTGTQSGMTLVQEQSLELKDEVLAADGARPRRLARTFEKIASSGEQITKNPMDAGSQKDATKSKSELEGKTVVFEWNEAKESWSKRFEPEGPDEELLAGLAFDADFTAFLPRERTVSSGDSWSVDASAMAALLRPCGELSLVPAEGPRARSGGAGAGAGARMQDHLDELIDGLEGEIEATYKGRREVDGASCGVIALEFKVHASRDLGEQVVHSDGGDPAVEPFVERVDTYLALEGEGELLWDLAAGHARSLTENAKLQCNMDFAIKLGAAEKPMDIRYKMQLSGSYTLQAIFTRR